MQFEPPAATSFYRIGLSCEAASDIGCGIRAKPILTRLETRPGILAAWLSRSGTTIAINWKSASEEDEEIVRSAFSGEDSISLEKMSDPSHHHSLLASLLRGVGWYRASEIDHLSSEEARIIAARIVGRISEGLLEPSQKAGLIAAIAEAVNRVLTTEEPGTAQSRQERISKAILQAGCGHLPEACCGVLRAAADAGHRPLPHER